VYPGDGFLVALSVGGSAEGAAGGLGELVEEIAGFGKEITAAGGAEGIGDEIMFGFVLVKSSDVPLTFNNFKGMLLWKIPSSDPSARLAQNSRVSCKLLDVKETSTLTSSSSLNCG